MAVSKGQRFPVSFEAAFPNGLVMTGVVMPDNEYQTREERAAGRPVRQRVDEATGLRQWKVIVMDLGKMNAKRASFEVTFLAEVQPVPTTVEALPGMRPVELEGLTAEPRVAGTGEFKYLSYVYRASGFRAVGASAPSGSARRGRTRATARTRLRPSREGRRWWPGRGGVGGRACAGRVRGAAGAGV